MNETGMKIEYPQYSVLMSVYAKENASNLRTSIESMFGQTVPPDEIVMIEDGPLTEELYSVLNEYSEKYGERFRRVASERNEGLGNALSKGIIECRNELIARMDTDDVSRSDRCEKQLTVFTERPDTDVVGGQISEFIETPENSVGQRIVPCTHGEICNFLKKRDPFNHPSVMFRKSAVLKAGNYKELHFNEDYYLWARMYLNDSVFVNLQDIVLDMRVGKDLYARRGGYKYFKCQKQMFRFLRKSKIISAFAYLKAITIRFVVQVLMPNCIRQRMYKKYARKNR